MIFLVVNIERPIWEKGQEHDESNALDQPRYTDHGPTHR